MRQVCKTNFNIEAGCKTEQEGKNNANDVVATIHVLPIPMAHTLAAGQPPVSSVPESSLKAAEDLQAVEESAPTSSHPSGGIILYPCPHLPQDGAPAAQGGSWLRNTTSWLPACLCLVSPTPLLCLRVCFWGNLCVRHRARGFTHGADLA